MTSPTNHEGGTEPRRRVSDAEYQRVRQNFVQWSENSFCSNRELALNAFADCRDLRATIAALGERAETAERERDALRDLKPGRKSQRRQIMRLRYGDNEKAIETLCRKERGATARALKAEERADKAEASLRDREQRGGQVTEEMVDAAAKELFFDNGADARLMFGISVRGRSQNLAWARLTENDGEEHDTESAVFEPGKAHYRKLARSALTAALAARPTGQPSDPVEARIAEAVEAERERCAKLADTEAGGRPSSVGWSKYFRGLEEGGIASAKAIAAAIRAPRNEGSET